MQSAKGNATGSRAERRGGLAQGGSWQCTRVHSWALEATLYPRIPLARPHSLSPAIYLGDCRGTWSGNGPPPMLSAPQPLLEPASPLAPLGWGPAASGLGARRPAFLCSQGSPAKRARLVKGPPGVEPGREAGSPDVTRLAPAQPSPGEPAWWRAGCGFLTTQQRQRRRRARKTIRQRNDARPAVIQASPDEEVGARAGQGKRRSSSSSSTCRSKSPGSPHHHDPGQGSLCPSLIGGSQPAPPAHNAAWLGPGKGSLGPGEGHRRQAGKVAGSAGRASHGCPPSPDSAFLWVVCMLQRGSDCRNGAVCQRNPSEKPSRRQYGIIVFAGCSLISLCFSRVLCPLGWMVIYSLCSDPPPPCPLLPKVPFSFLLQMDILGN